MEYENPITRVRYTSLNMFNLTKTETVQTSQEHGWASSFKVVDFADQKPDITNLLGSQIDTHIKY